MAKLTLATFSETQWKLLAAYSGAGDKVDWYALDAGGFMAVFSRGLPGTDPAMYLDLTRSIQLAGVIFDEASNWRIHQGVQRLRQLPGMGRIGRNWLIRFRLP